MLDGNFAADALNCMGGNFVRTIGIIRAAVKKNLAYNMLRPVVLERVTSVAT